MAKRKSKKPMSGADAQHGWEADKDERLAAAAALDAKIAANHQKKADELKLQQEQQRCAVRSKRPKRSPSVLSATGIPWTQLALFEMNPGPGKLR